MIITGETTVKEIIDACPEAAGLFLKHGVDIDAQCPEAILDFPVSDCESVCAIDDIDGLIKELQQLFTSTSS